MIEHRKPQHNVALRGVLKHMPPGKVRKLLKSLNLTQLNKLKTAVDAEIASR